ncbi:MAG: thermosome subunit beta [Halobacteriota archaeon]|uniref:thermosome subunit beta n=1 Tax=Natronomonas sp. TaxID=2184060 RepID=UPI003974E928
MTPNRAGDRRLHIASGDSSSLSDRSARQYNVMAARAITLAVGTTLGPGGLDKMLSDSTGEIVVTNDGETILNSMEVSNPAGRLLIDIAQAQAEAVGDGTTTAIVLGGVLLDNADELIERGLHPRSVIEGYERARALAVDRLEELGRGVDPDDTQTLQAVAETALTGSLGDDDRERLARLLVSAVQRTATDGRVYLDRIDTELEVGPSVAESELFDGGIYDRELLHSGMPAELSEARVLLMKGEATLEPDIPGDRRYTSFQVETPGDLDAVHAMEDEHRDDKVARIIDAGVNCVFCEKGIDDGSQDRLAEAGILALRRIDPSDLRFLRHVLGGSVLTHLDDIRETDIGRGSIERATDGERLYVTGENGDAMTLFLRAPTGILAEELERGVDDALRSIERTVVDGAVVPGAGATEIELARALRAGVAEADGRAQLAIEAAADAVEILPRTIVKNAGGNTIDIVASLRVEHDRGSAWAGWDATNGRIVDTGDEGIVDALSVKRQAINSAIEAATLILRIDDIITAGDLEAVPDDEA